MNDSERTETKWPGVDRLADRMWHSSLPEIQDELRRALEPLLVVAEEVANHAGKGMRGVVRAKALQSKLRKEIDVWRKR